MPDKQIPGPIWPDDPAAVQFNRALLGEAVHNQQFVKWIFQRLNRIRNTSETFLAHLKSCASKAVIDQQPLVGSLSEMPGAEIESESSRALMQSPDTT
jgi:hypothetical protein